MTSLPWVLPQDEPLGLVVVTGRDVPQPARIWAYLWSADEDDRKEPPHRRLPVFPVVVE